MDVKGSGVRIASAPGAAPVQRLRQLGTALPVLLDFLTGAGLLRLAGSLSWTALLTAALVIALRHLLSAGLRSSAPGSALLRGRRADR